MRVIQVLSLLCLLAIAFPAYGSVNSNLLDAAKNGDIAKTKLLLSEKANVNTKNEDGGSALMWASFKGYKGIVKILLKHGADVNAVSHNGMTAIMLAKIKGNTEIVQLLEKAGAVDKREY